MVIDMMILISKYNMVIVTVTVAVTTHGLIPPHDPHHHHPNTTPTNPPSPPLPTPLPPQSQ